MKIGVTGTYASGKGIVCSYFEELGAELIDTDQIAHDITKSGSTILTSIVETFGTSFLNTDGTLNRRELGKYVFSDKERTQKLNNIIHPLIKDETLKLSSIPDKIYVINVPLLFESGFDRLMDITITVSAKMEKSLERGILRDNLTREEIISRISRQFSLKEKASKSDYVIENSGDLENTKRQVIEIWNKIINKNQK